MKWKQLNGSKFISRGKQVGVNKMWMIEVNAGFPFVCYEYALLPLINSEAPLAYDREEYRYMWKLN